MLLVRNVCPPIAGFFATAASPTSCRFALDLHRLHQRKFVHRHDTSLLGTTIANLFR